MGELIVNGLKWAFFIGVGGAFAMAIVSLINLIVSIAFGNIIGEVLGIISLCLPFNAHTVFASIGLTCASILSFMIAQKIWDLLSNRLSL